MVVFEMPGGRILHIAPSSVLDNMISMEIVLFEGTRPLMTTDLKLMNHAVLIVAGPRNVRSGWDTRGRAECLPWPPGRQGG